MPDRPEATDLATVADPWSVQTQDLRARLILLAPDQTLPAHVNREVDLVLVGIAGRGSVTVDGEDHDLGPGQAVVVAKGTPRRMQAGGDDWRVLVVHRRTAVSSSWRWRPRRRRPWEDAWEEIEGS